MLLWQGNNLNVPQLRRETHDVLPWCTLDFSRLPNNRPAKLTKELPAAEATTWLNNTKTAMKPFVGSGGYINYPDPLLINSSTWQQFYYGDNYGTYRTVKTKWAFGFRPWFSPIASWSCQVMYENWARKKVGLMSSFEAWNSSDKAENLGNTSFEQMWACPIATRVLILWWLSWCLAFIPLHTDQSNLWIIDFCQSELIPNICKTCFSLLGHSLFPHAYSWSNTSYDGVNRIFFLR